ncbi:MAG: hypothetical protein ABI852_11315 [Gemmatimonadaceae bacterium]
MKDTIAVNCERARATDFPNGNANLGTRCLRDALNQSRKHALNGHLLRGQRQRCHDCVKNQGNQRLIHDSMVAQIMFTAQCVAVGNCITFSASLLRQHHSLVAQSRSSSGTMP